MIDIALGLGLIVAGMIVMLLWDLFLTWIFKR